MKASKRNTRNLASKEHVEKDFQTSASVETDHTNEVDPVQGRRLGRVLKAGVALLVLIMMGMFIARIQNPPLWADFIANPALYEIEDNTQTQERETLEKEIETMIPRTDETMETEEVWMADEFLVSADQIPSWFSEEVLTLEKGYDFRMAEDGELIGFSRDDSSEAVFRDIDEELVDRGWIGLTTGISNSSTYVKDTGQCHWLMVSCLSVASSTSVVIHVQR